MKWNEMSQALPAVTHIRRVNTSCENMSLCTNIKCQDKYNEHNEHSPNQENSKYICCANCIYYKNICKHVSQRPSAISS
jgi:hypothetical protein